MYHVIKALALPPANLVLVLLLGLVLRRSARRAGTLIAAVGAAGLYLLSTSFVATRLLAAVEADVAPPDLAAAGDRPGAIVILSAGLARLTPAVEPVTVDPMTLERLRYGARLHRATGLPILVTGGRLRDQPVEVARVMRRVLRQDFGVEPAWTETRSGSTHQNALFSSRILRPLGIRSAYVVSQAWHLPRAVAAFEAAGLSAVPAPSSYTRPAAAEIGAFLPSARALHRSYYAAHEVMGLAWYRWVVFARR